MKVVLGWPNLHETSYTVRSTTLTKKCVHSIRILNNQIKYATVYKDGFPRMFMCDNMHIYVRKYI